MHGGVQVSTRKQAAARKVAWQRALSEGRVIRYVSFDTILQCEQYTFVAYPTVQQATDTLAVQQARIGRRQSTYIDAHMASAGVTSSLDC